MSCLMEQLGQGGAAMTSNCSEVLMQIHFFLSCDIIIDNSDIGASPCHLTVRQDALHHAAGLLLVWCWRKLYLY